MQNTKHLHRFVGYIPRSQEHFGRPYVETTNASLASFQRMLKSKNKLPPRVLALQKHQAEKESQAASSPAAAPTTSAISESYSIPSDDMSPYKLPSDHPQKTFISGYTGFVPRLQNHFGEVKKIIITCSNSY